MPETFRAKRAVIYARASLDAPGEGPSVERQLEACRQLCELRGWAVVDERVDNSISASTGKERLAWKSVLAMVEAREVDLIVAWHIDRMTRSMLDLEELILLAENAGVGVATASGDLDLTTDVGRMVARILAAVARAEVERKGARQKLANAARAAEGDVHFGGVRPFGSHPATRTRTGGFFGPHTEEGCSYLPDTVGGCVTKCVSKPPPTVRGFA
ncbi:recombinase family protein [Streptomyces sp. NPDC019890]|uniref:recombinase family protein n=1 Tax=Streptomyces sp. NPDC019890 TaxID=3365064 RepID=UPI00384CC8F9